MGQNTDPTMAFLRRLDDPEWFVVEPNVPIFKPHKRRRPDGSEYEVKAADLPSIAAKMAGLEREHGVPARITEGHTRPQLPESMQPDLMGFSRNPRVGTFGPTNEPCILADLYYAAGTHGRAKRYPYRSAEFYPESGEIRGVALLMRDPFLDLGIVNYAQSNQPVYYALENTGMADEPKKDADLSPEDQAKADMYMAHYMKKHSWLSKCQAQYSAEGGGAGGPGGGAAMPGATNTSIPKPPGKEDDAERMQREQQALHYSRLQQQIDQFRLEAEKAKCEQMVMQLENENYSLDRATEVDILLPLTPDKRAAHIAYARQHYTRMPMGGFVGIAGSGQSLPLPQGDGGGMMTTDQLDKAIAYMSDKGCSWDDAEKFVKTGGGK